MNPTDGSVAVQAQEPIAPHELLNAARKAPSADPEGQQRLMLAKDLFVAYLRPAFESGKEIPEAEIKKAAIISVNSALILLQTLATR